MTIVSIKSENGEDLRRIELSDGSIFSFKICYLPPVCADETLYSAENLAINASQEEGFRFASACLRAEKAALQLIARAEQNTFGLSRKLEKRGHDSACVRAVIAQLCEINLLDDLRYGRFWLESRMIRQASSPRRLFAALCARIDRHDAEAVLKAALDGEAERQLLERYAHKLRHKRKNGAAFEDDSAEGASAEGSSAAARRSLRFLLKGEGFSSAAIQDYFDSLDAAF